ncbi:hypothetical protein [Brevundimonas sp. A19_0]|jgi:hypothetical protein|uniref:hypothetical protein n=1 Tax=Brevundimonas sp. A19_0 TaxID=2821087 RepID=UPI001ADAA19C|nr:hypothetical protein [Brevundimonas sp. A19_0]MBO9501522.1 hypothetical protein [Brevundimonas sp. A19_0]
MELPEVDVREQLREIECPETRARMAREFGIDLDDQMFTSGSGPQASLNRAIVGEEEGDVDDGEAGESRDGSAS